MQAVRAIVGGPSLDRGNWKTLSNNANPGKRRPGESGRNGNRSYSVLSAMSACAATTAGAITIPMKARAIRMSCTIFLSLWVNVAAIHNRIIAEKGEIRNPTKTPFAYKPVLWADPTMVTRSRSQAGALRRSIRPHEAGDFRSEGQALAASGKGKT